MSKEEIKVLATRAVHQMRDHGVTPQDQPVPCVAIIVNIITEAVEECANREEAQREEG